MLRWTGRSWHFWERKANSLYLRHEFMTRKRILTHWSSTRESFRITPRISDCRPVEMEAMPIAAIIWTVQAMVATIIQANRKRTTQWKRRRSTHVTKKEVMHIMKTRINSFILTTTRITPLETMQAYSPYSVTTMTIITKATCTKIATKAQIPRSCSATQTATRISRW